MGRALGEAMAKGIIVKYGKQKNSKNTQFSKQNIEKNTLNKEKSVSLQETNGNPNAEVIYNI